MSQVSLCKHTDSKLVGRHDLDLIQVPAATDSYIPIAHYQMAELIATASQDVLKDYVLVSESYGLARKGNQLFAVLNFRGDSAEMAMSIAFRNSYDKSLSFGMAFGAQVFVCENLCLHGDIVVMKKHSKNIWDTLEDTVIANIFKAQRHYEKVLIDSERLKGRPLEDRSAFQLMGLLYGLDIVSPRQLATLRDEWLNPQHVDFQGRNAWSFLNCTTEALKSSPPMVAMERHTKAYSTIIDV